jgi:hypothetical protein
LGANTSAANMFSIDSLEAAFTTQFQSQATNEQLQNSVEFGRLMACFIQATATSAGFFFAGGPGNEFLVHP